MAEFDNTDEEVVGDLSLDGARLWLAQGGLRLGLTRLEAENWCRVAEVRVREKAVAVAERGKA